MGEASVSPYFSGGIMASAKQLARQPGRGRQAEAPTEIPQRGWIDIFWRVFHGINEDRILLAAAGTTYYLLLALVPTLTAFVAIYGLFNDRATVIDQVALLNGLVPAGGLDIIRDQLTRLTTQSDGSLSITLIFSLLIAFWSASSGIKALFEAMNVAYHEDEKRSFFLLNAIALLFTAGAAIAAMLVIGVAIGVPTALAILPGGKGIDWTVRLISYVVMIAVLFGGISALYRWGPSREQAKWRWITPGAVLAVVALGAASVLFSWYVSNFTDYNAAYGSLGALIGMLTWIWISMIIVIVGAEVNSEVEHQTAKDSTTGHPKAMGERGAYMADTVGE